MMSTAGVGTWRPYEEEPVLTPAMTGGHRATPLEEMGRLRTYLEAVVNDRGGGPVHLAVAFNAAYFGYELGGEGYGNGAFDIDAFPSLTLGDESPALPVGALVSIETGSDPLYAEIIYKEGRHAHVVDGVDIPPWVSGAPGRRLRSGGTARLAKPRAPGASGPRLHGIRACAPAASGQADPVPRPSEVAQRGRTPRRGRPLQLWL